MACPQLGSQDMLPSAGATVLLAAAVPSHLHPGSGVSLGTGGGNRSRGHVGPPAAGNWLQHAPQTA